MMRNLDKRSGAVRPTYRLLSKGVAVTTLFLYFCYMDYI